MNSPITQLPDGSAFFTAEVMSREEAMKLPLEKRPLCFRISSEMYHAVFEAVGEASMCWKPHPGREVFQSEKASEIAVRLCFKIAEEVESVKSRLSQPLDRIYRTALISNAENPVSRKWLIEQCEAALTAADEVKP